MIVKRLPELEGLLSQLLADLERLLLAEELSINRCTVCKPIPARYASVIEQLQQHLLHLGTLNEALPVGRRMILYMVDSIRRNGPC